MPPIDGPKPPRPPRRATADRYVDANGDLWRWARNRWSKRVLRPLTPKRRKKAP